MERLKRIFAAMSVLFLAVLAISPLKDHLREWKQIQRKYREVVAEVAPREATESSPIHIQQVWLPKLNDAVDRCQTCHLGISAPEVIQVKLVDAPQPYRPHPQEEFHPFDKFGCTSCHRGQGRATNAQKAHGHDKHWDQPMLPGVYIEAGCGTCHLSDTVPDAPALSQGRKIIAESKCLNCHEIAGREPSARSAPDLDGLGSKVGQEWLTRWLADPHGTLVNATMPNFHLSDEEIQTLSAFLLHSKTPLEPRPDLEGDYDRGGTRFRESRCISCHPVQGKGGAVAPDLGQIAGKVNRRWLLHYLRHTHALQPHTLMPEYGLSEQDIVDIAEYIMLEFVDDSVYDTNPDWEPADEPPSLVVKPTEVEQGEAVYKKYGCRACHRIKGEMEQKGQIGPELTGIANKTVDELDFGKTNISHTLPDWLFTKVQYPRGFGGKLLMPSFGFSDEETQAVVTALLSLVDEQPPEEYVIPKQQPSTYFPAGEMGRIFDKYRCFSCHDVNGRGATVADADLSWEGSKVRTNWLENYMKTPFAIKPILEERMPRLGLSDEEARYVANYIKMVYRNDDIPEDIFGGEPPSAGLIEAGRNLFFNRYGCQACHISERSGGYIGPSLDNAPLRLTSGWVYQWLQNPQAIKPTAREPNFEMPDTDARALTAYVLYHPTTGGGE